jgi:Ca2+/Na+ antiporter
MTEFGVGTIFGSIVFCVTFVPAFAYFTVYGFKEARPELTPDEVRSHEKLRVIFIREMSFIAVGLAVFYVILENFSVTLFECCMFLVLFLVYIIFVFLQDKYSDRDAEPKSLDAKNREESQNLLALDQESAVTKSLNTPLK